MNRNPIKNWAITFPQSGEVKRSEFIESFPPALWAGCGMEQHADGGNHLHLGLRLKKGISVSKMIKFVKVKWPNDWKRIDIKATRSVINWVDYIKKEDGEYIERGNMEVKKRVRINMDNVMSEIQNKMMYESKLRSDNWKYVNGGEKYEIERFKKNIEEDDKWKLWLEKEGYGPQSKKM